MKTSENTPHEVLMDSPGQRPPLTRRQQEIAGLLSHTGLSYKQVAAKLTISEGTMRKHVENVYRRLGVHSRAELMLEFTSTRG
jgi:DNA-binding NarL/FixJ family response regulator